MAWTRTFRRSSAVRSWPAGVTQRSVNAGLPLDRADLFARVFAAPVHSMFSREFHTAPDLPVIERRLVGEVVDIDTDSRMVTARMAAGWDELLVSTHRFPMNLLPIDEQDGLAIGGPVTYQIVDWDRDQGSEIKLIITFGPIGRSRPSEEAGRFEASVDPPSARDVADAINNGTLRDEIDAALGWDPELAV